MPKAPSRVFQCTGHGPALGKPTARSTARFTPPASARPIGPCLALEEEKAGSSGGGSHARKQGGIYFHLVWATRNRLPLLTPDVERRVHRCIAHEVERLGCSVLAINGIEDHVHLVLKAPTSVSPAQITHQAKGVSSRFIRERLPDHQGFNWQEGYAVFSLSRPHKDNAVAYVRNQRQHHAAGTVWPEWEETDEEAGH